MFTFSICLSFRRSQNTGVIQHTSCVFWQHELIKEKWHLSFISFSQMQEARMTAHTAETWAKSSPHITPPQLNSSQTHGAIFEKCTDTHSTFWYLFENKLLEGGTNKRVTLKTLLKILKVPRKKTELCEEKVAHMNIYLTFLSHVSEPEHNWSCKLPWINVFMTRWKKKVVLIQR